MTPKNIANTMAALAVAGTPEHLRSHQLFTGSAAAAPAPAAGGAPLRAAPVAAEMIDWDAIVAGENSRLGLRPTAGAPPMATAEPSERPSHHAAAIDWAAIVDAVNIEAGFKHRGANVDLRLAAMLTGSSAQ